MNRISGKKGSKWGVDGNAAREKRQHNANIGISKRRETMVMGRREICQAADELYPQYGAAMENGKVAEWRAKLIKAYQDCKYIKFDICDPSEVGDLMELLAEMKIEEKRGYGGGKMVGGNPTAHFLKLQRWLTAHLGTGLDSMSQCAKWFIDKILDGLTAIGGTTVAGANIAFSASMDLARTALGYNDTQTFQYLLAFCGMITSKTYDAGEKVHAWLRRAGAAAAAAATATGAAAGAAATATGAAVGAVVQPYIDVFTLSMINLLTTQKDLFLGKIPGVNTPAQFDAWLTTLTMGDFMTATANIIAAGKWVPVAFTGGQIAGGIVLTTGYYGILAAAWISESYILTGTWLTYQVYSGLPVAQKESITEAFKAVDEYLAKGIDPNNKQTMMEFMKQIKHLQQDSIAKALVIARLKGEITEAKVKQDGAVVERAHVTHVQALTTALGDITAETTAIEQDTRNRQMHIDIQTAMRQAKANGAAAGTGADAHPIVEIDTTNAKGADISSATDSQTRAAAAGGGPGATPGATGSGFGATSGALPKMDATGSGFAPAAASMEMGGKRATRKRGKRSSKRGSRKTKTTRKKTTRKKRRGKK